MVRIAISLLVSLCVVFAFDCLNAQTKVWQPSPGHTQIPIWPKEPPDPQAVAAAETVEEATDPLVAGRPWLSVENVSRPTMTVYKPEEKNTGVAVVIFPGGGYEVLAIDLQGTEIADWLNSQGITAVLLKYRVPTREKNAYAESRRALQDAQRAVGLVRFHAKEWNIDPHKIGVIGFSAGGHMVAAISTNFEKRLYPVVDDADKESCRPDFAIAQYPGHLCNKDDNNFQLNPNVTVSRDTPPTFLLQAENDPVDDVRNSLVYYIALKKAGAPVEMHLYADGGHAFGIRRTSFPITDWPQLVERWLKTIGMISDDRPNQTLQPTAGRSDK
jgi:acetyl esterase/lipase